MFVLFEKCEMTWTPVETVHARLPVEVLQMSQVTDVILASVYTYKLHEWEKTWVDGLLHVRLEG